MPELQSPTAPFFAPWDGNGTAMAADLGEKPVTVNQWRARESIPPRAWPKIIEKASEKGHRLTLADFASRFLASA